MNYLFYNLLVAVSTVALTSCIIMYLFLTKRHRYWRNLGVPGPRPKFLYGNSAELIRFELTEAEIYDRYYKKYNNEDYIGIYRLWQPELLIRNYDLVKKIMEKDFDSFADRPGVPPPPSTKTDSVLINLFNLRGRDWKTRRAAFTKVFTPKKLKEYMEDMKTALSCLEADLESRAGGDVELTPIVRRFAATSVCMEMYGVDASRDPELVRKLCHYLDIFSRPPTSVVLKSVGLNMVPWFFRLFGIGSFPPELYGYFADLSKRMMDARVEANISRHDALEAVMQIKDVGFSDKEKISFEEAVGHIYIFFQASFDTMELSLCHALRLLALNPEAQDQARQEVESVLGGSEEITYEHIARMNYLDGVFCETMRIYPPVGVISRLCTKPYRVDGKLTIPEGMQVNIPVASLHMDPAFYPEPEKFQPERFLKKDDSGKEPWLPFGAGPKVCIGLRLAKESVMLVLAKILTQYHIMPSDKMKSPMKFDPKTIVFTVRPIDGFWINLQKRSS